MTKELKDYTTQELCDELNARDEVFTASVWMREDVERAFDDAEMEHDPETIDQFIDEFFDSFNEGENEDGFERLDSYITELFRG